jgi:hypothetical protein
MRRKSLIVVVAILMGTNFVFRWSASAHNIDLKKAREAARDYARMVREQVHGGLQGTFVHFSTSCVSAFPGHNHIVRCLIEFQNAADTKKGVYTCREMIEIKMHPHKGDEVNYDLYLSHASTNTCGPDRLNDTPSLLVHPGQGPK